MQGRDSRTAGIRLAHRRGGKYVQHILAGPALLGRVRITAFRTDPAGRFEYGACFPDYSGGHPHLGPFLHV